MPSRASPSVLPSSPKPQLNGSSTSHHRKHAARARQCSKHRTGINSLDPPHNKGGGGETEAQSHDSMKGHRTGDSFVNLLLQIMTSE